jgi:AcrR family transcriptional regulator
MALIRRIRVGEDGAAMTFAEIARAMGTTETAVAYHYKTGMRKLRLYPVLVTRLRSLAADLEDARRERTPAASARLPRSD